jgi:hypothetical protein
LHFVITCLVPPRTNTHTTPQYKWNSYYSLLIMICILICTIWSLKDLCATVPQYRCGALPIKSHSNHAQIVQHSPGTLQIPWFYVDWLGSFRWIQIMQPSSLTSSTSTIFIIHIAFMYGTVPTKSLNPWSSLMISNSKLPQNTPS